MFRVNFSKRGVGFSVGGKGFRYTHGSNGRKSVTTSIPGTGLSYSVPLSGKRTTRSTNNTTKVNDNVKKSNTKNKTTTKGMLLFVALLFSVLTVRSCFSGSVSVAEPSSDSGVGRDSADILEAATDEPEETEPEATEEQTESDTEEPKQTETETETYTPVTETPAITEAPIYIPIETTPPETVPPETEAPIIIVHQDSSMTPEVVKELEGIAFFWAPTGDKVHLDPTCRSFKLGFTYAGTLGQAQTVRTEGWCGYCANGTTSSPAINRLATKYALASCYSYSDYLNGIPSEAFH